MWLQHLSCLAHALNRVAEQIHSKYENVDSAIFNVRKLFLKHVSKLAVASTARNY